MGRQSCTVLRLRLMRKLAMCPNCKNPECLLDNKSDTVTVAVTRANRKPCLYFELSYCLADLWGSRLLSHMFSNVLKKILHGIVFSLQKFCWRQGSTK